MLLRKLSNVNLVRHGYLFRFLLTYALSSELSAVLTRVRVLCGSWRALGERGVYWKRVSRKDAKLRKDANRGRIMLLVPTARV